MHIFKWLGILSLLVFGGSCGNETSKTSTLKNGDILFCGTTNSDLSDAINTVTQTEEAHNYSHMGILSSTGSTPTVIHAYPEKGVCEEPLDTFIKHREEEGSEVYAYRIESLGTKALLKAVETARALVGKPYNDSYIISKGQESYYCSQLAHDAFASEEVFKLYPMDFKAPGTDSFYNTWIEYYEDLNIEIPQGKPGCNPNKMATNERLIPIGKLSLVDHTLLKY